MGWSQDVFSVSEDWDDTTIIIAQLDRIIELLGRQATPQITLWICPVCGYKGTPAEINVTKGGQVATTCPMCINQWIGAMA